MAPVDLIIDIIRRKQADFQDLMEVAEGPKSITILEAKISALAELKDELEGFKKLFS